MKTITLDDPRDFLVWREASGGTVEIFDVAVNSDRRKGRGRKLMQKLFGILPADTHVWAITRTSNEVAQLWYESMGFAVVGVLRRFYADEKSADAVMYGRRVGGPI